MQNEQRKQKELHDRHAVGREFCPGDAVYSREFGKQQKWRQGVIGAQTGPVSYAVLLDSDHEVHRHQDHVIRRETPEENGNELVVVPDHNEQPGQHPMAELEPTFHFSTTF